MKNEDLFDDVNRFKATIKKERDILQKVLSKETTKDVYIQAIYLGYLDACRTFRNQRKVQKNEQEVEDVAGMMKSYLDGGEDFDSMFYETCDYLCDKYDMKFGQAQKIINMAFKYLYCIADDSMKGRFEKCHLPLDGIMLEWIHRNIADIGNNTIKKEDAWSTIAKGTEEEVGTYVYYKKYIDKYCEDNKISPLQLDFKYWIKMSQRLAAENYLKTFINIELEQNIHIALLKEIS